MTVVTLVGYQPLPRYDALPWTRAKMYEASSESGAYTLIETFTFLDPDVDPSNPKVRNFTSENGTIDEGWYSIVFEDADGDTSPTDPVQNIDDPAADFLPLVSDVGALLRARTKDNLGNEIGTFTGATRPTYSEVVPLISYAARYVTSMTDTDIPKTMWASAAAVIGLRTAMLIELSYFPEQINTPRSPYEQLKALYEQEMELLMTGIGRENAEEESGEDVDSALEPSWSFAPNAGGLVGYRTNW